MYLEDVGKISDEDLFKQPPPQYGDCPICFLLLPVIATGSRYQTCCGKNICSGCFSAPVYDNQGNQVDNQKCPFCRTPYPKSDEDAVKRERNRMKVNDPMAMYNTGNHYYNGRYGYQLDYAKALEYWHRAGYLGYAGAYCRIGYAYHNGDGVDVDKKKASHYYELAAMKGNARARHNLGSDEGLNGNMERALKHYIIAVRSGCNDSLKTIKEMYSRGHVTKEDYTQALQSYQVYLGEIKSDQRDKAAADDEECRYY